MLLSVGAYWVGLNGPFLFDDGPNFQVIKQWIAGKAGLERVLFGNTSWATHRSLAMGSFALNAWALGYTPFSFKVFNLALHLLCGAVAWRLVVLLLRRDRRLAAHAELTASLLVAIWLLHPFNASTVLYAVQRMTQLASLCCLLGMWSYVTLRARIEATGARRDWILLFVLVPLLTVVGIQGKQNAAILPVLCLVLEFAYFRMPSTWGRQHWLFFGGLVLLPALMACIAFAWRPAMLLGGYDEYPFSLGQRLLSEARVLWDYIRMLTVPFTPAMGVYTDDYPPSTGWLSPPSTLFAVLGLIAASTAAWLGRKASPSIFAGWFLFLAGHAVEGSVLPIELYYEHRNYLPSLGLFLCCAGLLSLASARLAATGIRMGRVGIAIAIAACLLLAMQTHGRARVWSDVYTLAESALENHPDSSRAVLNYVGLAMESGDQQRALHVLDHTIAHARDAKLRGLARIFRIRMHCQLRGESSTRELALGVASLPAHVDLTMVQVLGYTRHLIERENGCKGISRTQFADALATTVDRASSQPDTAWAKWMLRYRAAALYAAEERWDPALRQARLAWQRTAPPPASELLIDIQLKMGLFADAERTFAEARARADLSIPAEASGLTRLRARIDRARRGEPRNEPYAWNMDVQ